LAGNDLAEHLRFIQQLADQRTFAQQRSFLLLGLEGGDQFVALAFKHGDLLGLGGHRVEALQTGEHALLQGVDLGLKVTGFAGLAEGCVDLHLVIQGLQISAQGQAAAEQIKALQFDTGALEFAPGITHQVIVGREHRQQEQHADQAELHAEAQAIHQRDGGIEQALHR